MIKADAVLEHAEKFLKLAKDKKWIQKSVKEPGRVAKLWSNWDDMTKAEKLEKVKKKYETIVKKDEKTKEEKSLMSALALAIRFLGGNVPGGKGKKGVSGKKS